MSLGDVCTENDLKKTSLVHTTIGEQFGIKDATRRINTPNLVIMKQAAASALAANDADKGTTSKGRRTDVSLHLNRRTYTYYIITRRTPSPHEGQRHPHCDAQKHYLGFITNVRKNDFCLQEHRLQPPEPAERLLLLRFIAFPNLLRVWRKQDGKMSEGGGHNLRTEQPGR